MANKKVGILTLCGNGNYGNKLQNYATVAVLSKLGYEPETIWVKNAKKQGLRSRLFEFKLYNIDHRKRTKMFKDFNKYLNISQTVKSEETMNEVSKNYSALLVGSDQVWNPGYVTNDSFYLLNGINGRKISFSASFGVDGIPESRRESYKKGLEDFAAISVREDRGKELVEEISGRKDAEVLIDPTMLLDGHEWDKIAKKPKNVPNKYILCYFLGKNGEPRRKEIEELAKERNCEIINILDEDNPFFNTGPSEFVYLEKHAELICTDSFHSSVFAILYKRPFIIYDRIDNDEKMNSRLDTLLKKFCLKKRNLNCDYEEAFKILKKEREKSLTFLKENLK
jgi:hypothetical protein